jgi:hypothetical protein
VCSEAWISANDSHRAGRQERRERVGTHHGDVLAVGPRDGRHDNINSVGGSGATCGTDTVGRRGGWRGGTTTATTATTTTTTGDSGGSDEMAELHVPALSLLG